MNVLVTGATGFLGSHIVKALCREGHRVSILKRSSSNCKRIAEVLPELAVYDIDKTTMDVPFRENKNIDAIIHTATCYGRNNESLTEIVSANLAFPLQLLETACSFGTKIFMNTDTFSNTRYMVSKHLLGYHLTKKHFREWGRHIAEMNKIRFINMRLEHLYGPFDSDKKFVSYVVKSCMERVPELLLTVGDQERDFIYVDDAVSAYLLVLQKGKEGVNSCLEYQVGTGKTTSIREFVELAHRKTRSNTILKFGAIPFRKNEIMLSKANIAPLAALGWSCKFGLEAGIEAIIRALEDRDEVI
ncbi:NAD-dependent epimerase/dehydratase family protein [Brevibacillus centrosporus]|uniref:NAD-dependent epimerase/dehydratase family protein n=1 Tax=Brevibacillus centrosporus TaxID=54910 RepID=UPI002E1E2AB0|nr:NAD-dependent epimerase/dehydratase family protein [Brevibacillus centrosporus]